MHRSLRSAALTAALLLSACGGPRRSEAGAAPPAPRTAEQRDDKPRLPAAGAYALDPPHTFVYFTARHKVVGQVRGRFDKMVGVLIVDDDPAKCSVDVTIDAASVDTQNAVRDDDLRSAAFFDVARSPTVTYRGRGVRPSSDGWMIDGVLTIRGVTKVVPLTFAFEGTAPPDAEKTARVAFRGRAGTKRAEFGMVRDLLEEIGENATGADVTIEIDTEALAKK
jgi:polyisoprenoid-binding protein YceI